MTKWIFIVVVIKVWYGMEDNKKQDVADLSPYFEPKINIKQNAVKAQLSLLQGFAGLLSGCVIGLFLSHNHTSDWQDFSKYSGRYDISRDHKNTTITSDSDAIEGTISTNVSISNMFREKPRSSKLHISEPNSFGYQPNFSPFKNNKNLKESDDNYSYVYDVKI